MYIQEKEEEEVLSSSKIKLETGKPIKKIVSIEAEGYIYTNCTWEGQCITLKNKLPHNKMPVRIKYISSTVESAYEEYIASHKSQIQDTKNIKIKAYKDYIEDLQKGIIPEIIRPQINLNHDKDKLKRDFENFIDNVQPLYYEQNPQDKSYIHGQKEYKDNKRGNKKRQSHSIETMENRFKTYVYKKRFNKTFPEIAEILHSKDKGNIDRVEGHYYDAEKIIKNVRKGFFPGKLKNTSKL
jgi:hypothetical protein